MPWGGGLNTNKYTTSNHGTIGLNLGWSYSQNIADNTTTINWVLTSNGTMSSGYYVQAGPVTVKIGGVTVLNVTTRFNMRGDGGYSKSGSVTIQHNEDGTKSVSMSVRAAIYSASVNCTGSKTFTLNKIDRYALISEFEDFTDEGNPTITYINPAGSELVTNLKVRLTWNNGANYTAWNNLNVDGGTFTFDLDSDRTALRSACANSNTLAVKYDLQSELNGTEYHNYKDAVMSVINADPTAGAITYADTDATTSGITGDDQIIVQSQSTLQIHTAAATPKKEATISSYSLNFNGVDYTPDGNGDVDIVKPNYAGTFTATVTATDSRGNTGTATLSIPITAWAQPSATIALERVNGFETNTTLTVDGSISSVTGSSMSITEEHSDDNGSTWTAAAAVTDNTPTTLSLLNTSEWLVRVKVWDSFTSGSPTVYVLSVGKGIPIAFIDADLNAIGVNGFPDDNNQIYVDGTVKATGMITAPAMSVQDISAEFTFTKSGGNWNILTYQVLRCGNVIMASFTLNGNGDAVAAASNGWEGTVTVDSSLLPPVMLRCIGYSGGAVIFASIDDQGNMTIRNTVTSTTLNAGSEITVMGTYIIYS